MEYRESKEDTFQLTASRRGWPDQKIFSRWLTPISTHSLTKRLTTFQPCLRGKKTISTHSLTKRLTHYIVLRSVCTGYFNSQPHEEADKKCRPCTGIWISISTHSLTKRLTSQTHGEKRYGIISTHSLTKRLTYNAVNLCWILVFQLTASRRGWPFCMTFVDAFFAFQLTASRRGWRYALRCICCTCWYFNSQPHEEADWEDEVVGSVGGYFNSQPHEEADVGWSVQKSLTVYFNSQPHEEADSHTPTTLVLIALFQLTASRRGWPSPPVVPGTFDDISTHSLTKRLTDSQISGNNVEELFQLTASRRGWRQSVHCPL